MNTSSQAVQPCLLPIEMLPRAEMERAFYAKDAGYDGIFFVAVRTTGIFCRPSCSARPKPENIEFFPNLRQSLDAGYRPCKRCHPLEAYGALPSWVEKLMRRMDESPNVKVGAPELEALGVSPERARRWFREHLGMTFSQWCRGRQLGKAFTQMRDGAPLDDVVFDNGYESHSGFRAAFGKTFGVAPGQSRSGKSVCTQLLETPLGPLLVGAVDEGICLVEYADKHTMEQMYENLKASFAGTVLPLTHAHIETLRDEMKRYFEGELTAFCTPIVPRGTQFQERVWAELRSIPFAQTIAYDALAERIGQPTAVRAVARANGMNRINILIPCHRVIGKDGQLTGYGGGLWRKRLLLELERTRQMLA